MRERPIVGTQTTARYLVQDHDCGCIVVNGHTAIFCWDHRDAARPPIGRLPMRASDATPPKKRDALRYQMLQCPHCPALLRGIAAMRSHWTKVEWRLPERDRPAFRDRMESELQYTRQATTLAAMAGGRR